jgi:hypothetical protein
MAGTPEGKVKKMVKNVLAEFADEMVAINDHPTLKQFWPVPSGFGESDLDCIVCYHGNYIAIETKAPGKNPTPRQGLCIARTQAAGGTVFVIDNEAGCELLRQHLRMIKNANDSKRQA